MSVDVPSGEGPEQGVLTRKPYKDKQRTNPENVRRRKLGLIKPKPKKEQT